MAESVFGGKLEAENVVWKNTHKFLIVESEISCKKRMSSFVHLHNHTHYSLLDGLAKPIDYIKLAKAQGSNAVGITDHGVLYGVIEFYQKAREHDIKPIIGCEAYLARRSRHEKQAGIDNKSYHLTLIAENNEGYKNLIQLISKAHIEGFYYRPRIDKELIKEYARGIICLSGCLQGELARTAASGNMEGGLELIKEYQTLFGKENFYIELMHHPEISEQEKVNMMLIKLAKETSAPLIATNDCHYAKADDHEAHDILICIQTQCTVDQEERMQYNGNFSLRSPEEMRQAFRDIPEAVDNTLEVAERCHIEMNFGRSLMPAYKSPDNKTAKEYLEELCQEGLKKRYGEHATEEAKERLKYELEIIHSMGFDTYFLIIQDLINYAKKKGIMVGPGRGSAAGSIISYCLGITDIDPLKYHLLFERFLNPERVSMPDIDIDFADDRRDEVLEYVIEKYGSDKVAQIITFGTMAARAAVRDVGRALGMSYSDVDKIAKLIPARPGTKLQEALEEEPDLKASYENSEEVKRLIDTAIKLEGCIRHASVHACAVVISAKPLTEYTPLQKAPGKDESIITQFSMKPIDNIGLLKMDFLGLKNLTILEHTIQIIQRTKNETIDIKTIPLDDKETFKLMAEGKTTGVFQFESSGMRRYLKQLIPTRFEDLIAMNALYRPGPMEWIPAYIRGKQNQGKIQYLDASFKSELEETYGVAVYQEQILKLAQQFSGFSLGEADILRKAVGKKIPSLLGEQRTKFIQGAVKNGHSEKFAVEVFEKVIEPFAGYGFNKAHATCYAMIAYQTAYLKTKYPAEFMTALLTADQDNLDRIAIIIEECDEMGITVLPPEINESLADFTTIDDKHIRFGLSAIKGLGAATIHGILEAREKGGKFTSIDDFARKVPVKLLNKKSIEALARSGTMDDLGERNAMAESIETIVNYAKNTQTSQNLGQTDIFSMLTEQERHAPSFELATIEPATHTQRLKWEKEYLGLYVTSHPLHGLRKFLRTKMTLIEKLTKKEEGKSMKLGGIITKCKKISTKHGNNMMYLTLEDPTGRIEVTIFPKIYGKYKDLLEEDKMVMITGRLEYRRGECQFIGEEVKNIILEKCIERAKKEGLYDEKEKVFRATKKEEKKEEVYTIKVSASANIATLEKIKELLKENQGDEEVEIHIVGKQTLKRIKVPFGIRVNSNLKKEIRQLTTS